MSKLFIIDNKSFDCSSGTVDPQGILIKEFEFKYQPPSVSVLKHFIVGDRTSFIEFNTRAGKKLF